MSSSASTIYLRHNEIYKTIKKAKEPKIKKTIKVVKNVSLKCKTYKYGVFIIDNDTLKRFRLNSKDYQLYRKDTIRIKWISDCIYAEVNPKNNAINTLYKMENFKSFYFNTKVTSFERIKTKHKISFMTIPLAGN